jgi:transposase-like protein
VTGYPVHVNIVSPRNDQDRFTAERVARTRPKTYRAIVRLLAEPDARIEHIAQRHRVSTHTVRAIRERETVAIAERKQRLVSIFGNVAEIAGERMEELAGQATLRDAGITAGIATDKLLALLGEAGGGVPVNINLEVNAQLLHAKYAELVKRIEEEVGAENKQPLPDGETVSEPPVAMDLQSGEENLQK